MTTAPACRFCRAPLIQTFVDLGATSLANSYLSAEQLAAGIERAYPLHARVCGTCFLVQVDEAVPADEVFSDYAYFSSYSDSWVAHAKAYADAMIARFALGAASLVVEVASNDGYLLKHFKAAGVPVLGIEPAANVAATAVAAGIPTRTEFFGAASGARLKAEGRQADLMAANNVLAHVPDIRDFVAGFAMALKPEGVLTFEFPHLLNLIDLVQFDTIYHEHYSYLSLLTVERVLDSAGLRAFDVAEVPTHGGSLRVFVCHGDAHHADASALFAMRKKEAEAGLDRLNTYAGFGPRVRALTDEFTGFLRQAKADGKSVAAYGAAAKGNTMLNFAGVGPDLIGYVVDRSPAKQGKFLPGSHIPIHAPDRLEETRPGFVVILPWNLKDEIAGSMAHIRGWGGRFVTAVPRLEIF